MEIKKLVLGGVIALGASLAAVSTASAAAPDGAAGPWADSVVSFTQGLRNNGTPVDAVRSDATQALGAAETTGAATDNPTFEGQFFGLGFGGTLTLKFDNGVEAGSGNDLQLFEVTYPNYPDEVAKVEVSPNGTTWYNVGTVARDGAVDFGNKKELKCISYVRITDISAPNDFPIPADAYDVDAVKSLHSNKKGCKPPKDDCKNNKKCACGPGGFVRTEVSQGTNTSTLTAGSGSGVITQTTNGNSVTTVTTSESSS